MVDWYFSCNGARILRKHPEIVGLKTQFSIIDIDDQIRLINKLYLTIMLTKKNGPQIDTQYYSKMER